MSSGHDEVVPSTHGERPVAVVTGSSSGIGRAIAVQLAMQGFDLVVHAGRNRKRAAETAAIVQSYSASAIVNVCDFTQVADGFERFVDEAFAWRGSVACWINNAGGDVLTGERKDWSFADKLDYLWQVDVRSTLLISRLVADRMIRNRHLDRTSDSSIGVVINVGWDQAQTGLPGPSGQMFACTKGAIMSMTAALAKTYAPLVRFNCVAPGWIQTQWGKEADPAWSDLVAQQSLQKRWGLPNDVASVVGFLVSPAAAFVNGQCLPVNGGLGELSSELRNRLC